MINPELCKERMLSENYMDFIVTDQQLEPFPNLSEEELCKQNIDLVYDYIAIENTGGQLLPELYIHFAIPHCFTLADMEAMNQSGITVIQNYPTLQLKGEGVIIGVIDTGIDYQNKIFRNLDGTTRIAAIWDQTIQTGTPPQGMLYGSEYTRDMINQALNSENPLDVVPSIDEDGHGTFVVSLAAGSAEPSEQFLGAAPEATIAVVKLKQAKQYLRDFYIINKDAACYQVTDMLFALKYLNELALKEGKPLVTCLAMASNQGAHASVAPGAALMEYYANLTNRVLVLGTGNEANQQHHYSHVVKDLSEVVEVRIDVGRGVKGFTMELWTDIPNIFGVSIVSPSGEEMPQAAIRGSGGVQRYDFIFERTQVYLKYQLLVEKTNSELIFFRFLSPTPGIWRVRIRPSKLADGVLHMWLPVKEFLTGDVIFLEADPYTTMTAPGTSEIPITVSYYNGADNSIAISSGRGFTRDNRIKPDFAAPGVNVKGGLPHNRFTVRTGSSIATGITAGAAALLLQWNVYQQGKAGVDSTQIKNQFILGAQQKTTESYPNREWGYGKLDLYGTLDQMRRY